MKHPPVNYSRREFLKNACLLSVIPVFTAFSVGCNRDSDQLKTHAQRMIGLLNHPERARELGAVYRSQETEFQQYSEKDLTRKLLITLGFDPETISEHTLISLDERFRERVRLDFLEENVVVVKGWMLSKTEIWLCSLAYISSDSSSLYENGKLKFMQQAPPPTA